MHSKILVGVLLVSASLIAACVPIPATSPSTGAAMPSAGADNLADTSWILASLGGQPALSDTTVTLNFADEQVSGSDGCNRYTAPYTADGSTIQIKQPMASTMMACPDPIMSQASNYMEALGKATTYKIDRMQLTLLAAGGNALASFTAVSSDLSGSAWDVISYNNGKEAVVSVALGTSLTANFGDDGVLSGSAGCNNYTASYETDENKISIGPAATTRKMCAEPPEIMQQEAQYLQALSTAATYRIDGMKMEFRTADGALAAMFQRAQ